jgi:hypothetical protein
VQDWLAQDERSPAIQVRLDDVKRRAKIALRHPPNSPFRGYTPALGGAYIDSYVCALHHVM